MYLTRPSSTSASIAALQSDHDLSKRTHFLRGTTRAPTMREKLAECSLDPGDAREVGSGYRPRPSTTRAVHHVQRNPSLVHHEDSKMISRAYTPAIILNNEKRSSDTPGCQYSHCCATTPPDMQPNSARGYPDHHYQCGCWVTSHILLYTMNLT